MKNKQLLAEYKLAYDHLGNIVDNGFLNQVSREEFIKLNKALEIIEQNYTELYERIKHKNKPVLEYQNKTLIISDIPYYDYIIKEDNSYVKYNELLSKPKWWIDVEFLDEF